LFQLPEKVRLETLGTPETLGTLEMAVGAEAEAAGLVKLTLFLANQMMHLDVRGAQEEVALPPVL
jgi:hypothetical protein